MNTLWRCQFQLIFRKGLILAFLVIVFCPVSFFCLGFFVFFVSFACYNTAASLQRVVPEQRQDLIMFCVFMFEQKSDAGGEEVEIPVENQAFMDDFFAQVRLCHITMLPGGVPVWPFLMCACVRVGVRVFVCVRLYGWRLKTFAPASTRLTRVSMKSRSSTPPSCRLQPPIRVSVSPPLCFWSWTPLHNNTYLSYNLFLALSRVFSESLSLSETQDDLEAITNEIKKAANNARNKLKSQKLCLSL